MSTEIQPLKRISPAEFAALIGVSEWTVYKMIKERSIPYVKLGTYRSRKQRILINPASAVAALEKRYMIPARP